MGSAILGVLFSNFCDYTVCIYYVTGTVLILFLRQVEVFKIYKTQQCNISII